MNNWIKRKASSVVIWLLSLLSVFFVLTAGKKPVLDVFRNTQAGCFFVNLPTVNSLIFSLSSGFLVSVIFYLLVVWFPDKQRKNLIKRNFEEHYRSFREHTIAIFLSASNVAYDSDLPKELSKQSEFRKYFKEAGSESQDRWDTVLNGLKEPLLKELLVELEILRNEVAFVLNNVNIEDQNIFSFFKRLSQAVYRLKNSTYEYDDIKQLSRFLWELFAGWSFIEGYRENDIVEVMIRKI